MAKDIELKVKVEVAQAQFNIKKIESAEKAYAHAISESGKKVREINSLKKSAVDTLKNEEKLVRSAKGSYNALSAQYSLNKQKLNAMSAAERGATVAGRKLEKETKAIYLEMDKLQKRTGKAQLSVGKYSQGIKNAAGQLLGGFGLVAATQKLISTIGEAIAIHRAFSKEQSTLAGVLGVTRDETVALTDDAKRLGRATEFTAVEVTQLQTAYARLGFTQREILNMTEATLSGSSAMQSELGETAALTGSIIRSFNKDSKESAQVIDVMAAATQKSALDFQKLQTALPIVGSAAHAVGESFETMTARLAKTADAGIDASTSATSLRNIYIELKKSGLSMDDALTQINVSTDKLSTANELFGKRAAVTALVLADNKVAVKDLATEFDNAAGAAGKLQSTQLDNLDGDIKKLSSAWEGFMLLVEKGDGLFRNIVQNTTKLVNKISGASSDFEGMGKALGKSTIESLTKSAQSADDFEASLIKAKEAQAEIIKEQQKAYGEARSSIFGEDVTDVNERLTKNWAIQKELEEEGAIALKEMREKETIERFNVEEKSIEKLKELRESLSTFTIGKEKEKADLLIPLIDEQLQKRLSAIAIEEEARIKAKEKSDKDAQDLADKLEEESDKEIDRLQEKEDRDIERDERELERLQEKEARKIKIKADAEIKADAKKEKSDKKAAADEVKLNKKTGDAKLKVADATADAAIAILGKESKAGKAVAIAQAGIDTYKSANSAYAAMAGIPVVGPALGAVAAGAAIVSGLANINAIKSQKFATGGVVQGPTTGDTVPIMANGEEMILTKQQQANLFQMANNGNGQSFDYERLASLINDKQVVVLESDITEVQKKVEVRESEFQG